MPMYQFGDTPLVYNVNVCIVGLVYNVTAQ